MLEHQFGAVIAVDPSTISTGGEGSNSDQQLMSEESQKDATKKGLIIGGTGAAAVGGLAAGPLIAAGAGADPVVTAVVSHLGKLKTILDAAAKLGFTSGGIGWGIKEARDLYKEFSKESK